MAEQKIEDLYGNALSRLDYFRDTEYAYISSSSLQRMFRIGYHLAESIIDRMEKEGYISTYKPGHPRKVLKTIY